MPQFRTARMTEFGSNVSKHHHERVLMALNTRSARSFWMHGNRRITDRQAQMAVYHSMADLIRRGRERPSMTHSRCW
jgi:hypothetical protein